MQSSDVQNHTGRVDRPYKSLGMIEAKRSKRSAFSPDPTIEEVNEELRQAAAERFANAVIEVQYKRSVTMFSYGVLTAWGVAVILESDDKVCPSCAETIKRAAVKCRFCGADVTATK